MKMPLGRPNWRHSSSHVPFWSKIWMRLFSRSPTNSRPRESIAIVCGSLNSPRPDPFRPHSLTNVPSFVNRTTRLFFPFRWLSVTKMSPAGETTTSVG